MNNNNPLEQLSKRINQDRVVALDPDHRHKLRQRLLDQINSKPTELTTGQLHEF